MGRLRFFSVVLCCWLVAGCQSRTSSVPDASSDGTVTPDAGVDGSPPADLLPDQQGDQQADGPPPVPCKPPTTIQSEADLIAALDALAWEYLGPYSSKVLQVSDDLQINSEIVLDGAKLAVPASCQNAPDCRHEVAFQLPDNLAGVTCKTQVTAGWVQVCKEISITSTTVRFRANLVDSHPSEYNFVPIITVVPECNAACAQGEIRCPATNTCWSSFLSYCKLCLAKGNQTCPCLSEQGPQPDGTSCNFMVSGDVICGGECQDGVCEHTGKPGWAGCP